MTTEIRTFDIPASADQDLPTDFDLAMAEAVKAGRPNAIEGFVERIAERLGGKASVRSVFGDPVERDGLTIIPVAKVRYGFGGGAGRGPVAVGPGRSGEGSPFSEGDEGGTAPGMGTGGGGAVTADPIGYLEIGPQGAAFRPITPVMPSPAFLLAAGVTAALVLRALAKLLRR